MTGGSAAKPGFQLFSQIRRVGELDVWVRAIRVPSRGSGQRIEVVLKARGQIAIVDVPPAGDPEHIAEVALAIFAAGLQSGP